MIREAARRLGPRAIASRALPHPRIRGPRRPPGLTDVLLASDLNPRYLGAWPAAQRMWHDVGGVRPHLVLVAPAADVPPALAGDPHVHVFEPIDGLHTAFQAQCIRLLYPALLETEGAVLISDVDMAPLSRRYFHEPMERVHASHFVAYRDVLLPGGEIPICYNAALPAVWSAIFGVRALDDVRSKLVEWGSGVVYEGTHGGQGWGADQVVLYRTLTERARTARDVWILRDGLSGFERLKRVELERRGHLVDEERARIRRGAYTDFHLLVPYEEHRALNDEVIRLAVDGVLSR